MGATTRENRVMRIGLAVLAVGVLGGCGEGRDRTGVVPPSSQRPNVLILVADDLGAELACYGTPGLETPRLDRLAAEGVRFTRAYAPTGVCVPSRTTLYTGLEPARHGALGFEDVRPDVALFGDRLAGLDYRTGLLGKLGARPIERFRFDWLERTTRDDEGARDLLFHVRQFEAFLDAGDARPFAFIVNFRDAHWPLPTDGAPAVAGVPVSPHDPGGVAVPPVLVDGLGTRAELARYYDALRRLDTTAGALLDVLERRGLAQGTLVLFTSDNGPPFPRAKTTLYEWGLRQAFLVRWPGVIAPGRVDERFVTLADVLPTVMAVAGAGEAELAPFDGRSLLPLLRGTGEVPWRTAVFGLHGTHRAGPEVPSRSVRWGRWKYIWNVHPEREFENLGMEVSVAWAELTAAADAGDEAARTRADGIRRRPAEELYDLDADPWELTNLAADARHSAALAEARARLGAHLVRQGDPLASAWPY